MRSTLRHAEVEGQTNERPDPGLWSMGPLAEVREGGKDGKYKCLEINWMQKKVPRASCRRMNVEQHL